MNTMEMGCSKKHPPNNTWVNDGARTHDNRNHNPGLYQLSYVHHRKRIHTRPAGLEPATLGLEGRCSILLSYGRIHNLYSEHNPPNPRGRGIRTPDILLPKQARYQTALYPDIQRFK